MRLLFLVILFVSSAHYHLFAQGYVWSRGFLGASDVYGKTVATDAAGNVFTSGYFTGTVDFDPGAGVYNLTSAGNYDIYICKLTAAGVLSWARRIGATEFDYAYGMAIDASGNVVLTGHFEGTVDFDPNAGISNLTSSGTTSSMYVLKLSTTGNFVWVRMIGAGGGDFAYALTIDASSNIIFAGRFTGTDDFDPGAGVFNLTSSGIAGYFNAFVAKLNSSGNFVWARRFAGTEYSEVLSIAADPSGNIYTTGRFSSTIDFDPGTGVANLTSGGTSFNTFVSKLNASGNFVLAKKFNGVDANEGWGIDVDDAGTIYVAGWYYTAIDLDPNAGTANRAAVGSRDAYFCKLTSIGNFSWGYSFGSAGIEEATSVVVDINGNPYLTGRFSQTIDFNPGAAVNNLVSTLNSSNVFIVRFNISGAYVWGGATSTVSGTTYSYSTSIALDATNNVYVTGRYSGSVDFNPGAAVNSMTSSVNNAYILKLNNPSPLPVELLSFDARQSGNDIVVDWATAVEINNAFFTLERSNGIDDWMLVKEVVGSGNTIEMSTYLHHDRPPHEGVWYYRLRQTDHDGAQTLLGTVSVNYKLEEVKFSIFPNPTIGWLNVKLNDGGTAEVFLFRTDGRRVADYSLFPHKDGFLMDLSSLPKGVYIIRVAGFTARIMLI